MSTIKPLPPGVRYATEEEGKRAIVRSWFAMDAMGTHASEEATHAWLMRQDSDELERAIDEVLLPENGDKPMPRFEKARP